nr:STAS-like domain-containing protein [[Eubacterium] tenue]
MILSISKFGEMLSTRDIGAIIRKEIILSIKNKETITVDFEGVKQMTHSCADEIFGKLAIEIGMSNLMNYINIKNANETISTIIKYVIARRLSDSK